MSRIPRPVSGLSRSLRLSRANSTVSEDDVDDVMTAAAANLTIGDRVCLPGDKVGTLRYRGPTQFKPGEWAGVELDNRQGLNDGAVNDVRYFTCAHGHGIFVPISRVRRIQSPDRYSFCNGYRPCSTTPSLSGRSKEKSFSVSTGPPGTPTNGRRQTRRYIAEEAGNGAAEVSNACRLGSQRIPINNEQNAMLNAAMLERDKAMSLAERLKRQVEDLEFQLEEEKARSIIEDKPAVSDAACQADIDDPELHSLRSSCSRLTHMNKRLMETRKDDENAARAMSTICAKLEDNVDTLERTTVPLDQYRQLQEQITALKNQCSEKERWNQSLRREIHDLRNLHSASIEDSRRKIRDLEGHITSLEEEKLSSMGKQVMDLMADCHSKDDRIKEQSKLIEDLEAKLRLSSSALYKSSFTCVNETIPDSSRYVGSDSNGTYTSSNRAASRYPSSFGSPTAERSSAGRWYSTFNDTLVSSAANSANTYSTNTTSTTSLSNKKSLNVFRTMRYP